MKKQDFLKIEEKLKKHIDEKRYMHTKGVEMTCACMAMKYASEAGMDEEEQNLFLLRARLAGLLHDNAKNLTDEEFLKECKKHEIVVSETQKHYPYLLHGPLGAYYLSARYGIEDEEIASAIACHTTGKPAMSLLEKILFVADYIEPNRKKQPNLALVRHLAFTDLDGCILQITEDTLAYLSSHNGEGEIDDMTVATRDYYKEVVEGRG